MDAWAQWFERYPKFPPVGHILRSAMESCWFRVYGLPEGKRTPTNEAEFQELQNRYRTVGDDVLGVGSDCIMWLTQYGADPIPDDLAWTLAPAPPTWNLGSDLEEELSEARFYYAIQSWHSPAIDEVFRRLAVGDLGPVAVMSVATSCTVCPYEGGMDIFVRTRDTIPALKEKFRAWLSPLASGL